MQKTRMKEAVGIIEECMPYRYLENIATVDVALKWRDGHWKNSSGVLQLHHF